MTTKPQEFRLDRRSAEHAGRESVRLHGPETRTGGWTPAHTEAAWFVGECLAAGALLGVVTELARPMWDQRRAEKVS